MTGTLSFCTGTISVDAVRLCANTQATNTVVSGGTAGGAITPTKTNGAGVAHWPVATGGMAAMAAVGVAGLLI